MHRPSLLLIPVLLLLGACREGHSTGQGRLIGCYADTPRAKESVRVVRENQTYVMSFRVGQSWRRVDAALRTADDAQIATRFSPDEAAGIDDILLTPDGRSGVALLTPAAALQNPPGTGSTIVIERGRPRLMVKKRCQWLFARGHYLRQGD